MGPEHAAPGTPRSLFRIQASGRRGTLRFGAQIRKAAEETRHAENPHLCELRINEYGARLCGLENAGVAMGKRVVKNWSNDPGTLLHGS